MRAWLLAVFLGAAPASGAGDSGLVIPRYLAGLYLGDTLEEVQRLYPPAQEWPAQEVARLGVTRRRVERACAKRFPEHVETMWLGFRKGALVDIQLIYNEKFSGRKSAEVLAGEQALNYGEPRRGDGKFFWSDGRTVLRIFAAELESPRRGATAVTLRASVQILERDLFRSVAAD